MRLDQELVLRALCESRQEAQECIEQGYVLVDGVVTTKKTRQVYEASVLVVTKRRTFVSRGGEKLEGVLLSTYTNKELVLEHMYGKSTLDIGSSTGGFTDCLLSYGVHHVTAVDVGTAQFHAKLRDNPRITLFENTDIRNFVTSEIFDIIVADLSFIALHKIVDTILLYGHNGTEYFLLIKPQFEVGFGNTKKGIVKNKQLVEDILMSYTHIFSTRGFSHIIITPCVLQGGDGNQEYFVYLQK